MIAEARTSTAASLATGIIVLNLLDRLAENRVLTGAEIRNLLAVSASELERKRSITSAADAIDFINAMLSKLVEKHVGKD
ncbi:MAG: hypothetical protein ACRED5_00415 [Propylenella sp.]